MDGASIFTFIPIFAVAEPAEFSAETVYVIASCAVVGVPLISQVELLIASPAGRLALFVVPVYFILHDVNDP